MEDNVYLILAVAGGTVFLAQLVLQILGLHDDADMGDVDAHDVHDGTHFDADHDGNWFAGIISFKTIVAFCTVFGLTGLSLGKSPDMGSGLRAVLSFCAGAAAMVLVAWMMKALYSLGDSGSLDLSRAVGREGSVYLRIPGEKAGPGKVTLELQGRSVELSAMTEGEPIPAGQRVRIDQLLGDETVLVSRA